ncbi:protein PML-like [Rhineura floridana]|uniref:protein PML-like n=1 Tax=Rhineura floridana TaxID=261503 RepID=UPI002AC85C1A|nr:protein PML-like [Rhineura floridana]
MAQETSASPSENEAMDEFQFLLCERCQGEVQSPKLLPCLHNLCTQCLKENKSIHLCATCGTSYMQNEEDCKLQENLLFANLQVKLRIWQKIKNGKDLICINCKNEAVSWCFDCNEFLCAMCLEFHQRYMKREGHEAKPLRDLQAESSMEFLAGIRKQSIMSCSNIGHKGQALSIYCNECQKSMCCVCALLDRRHNEDHHCDIQNEIGCRQNELQSMSTELKGKKSNYNNTYNSLLELVKNMEKVRNETREQIQQKVGEMVKVLREKEEKFLAEVEEQHKQQVQNVEKKLKDMEGVVKRMASSEQLVEKMHLYASDQEVLEMHSYIKGSLQELIEKQPPVVDLQIEVGNFGEVKAQLQSLFDRVTNVQEAVPARLETASNQVDRTMKANSMDGNHICGAAVSNKFNNTLSDLPKSLAKRKRVQEERAIQILPKVIKTEPDDSEWVKQSRPPSNSLLEEPGTSSQSSGGSHATGGGGNAGEGMNNSLWTPVSSSSESDDASFIDSCSEEEATDDESVGSILLQDINNRSQSSQEEHPRQELASGQGTMVFFDLKLLSEDILHLAAVAEEGNCFSVLMTFSPIRSNFWDSELEEFLDYLHFLRMPILVGYKIWSMDLLPALFSALQNINKEEKFEASVFGFVDALPLLKEKNLEVPSYTLKDLDSIYLWGELNNTQAVDCAKTLKNLCTVLEVNPVREKKAVTTYSSLRCYASLQPLLRKKLLSKPSAQTLALHNICLSTLQREYQKDPEKGLKKLCRYLNSRRRDTEKKIRKLSKIRIHFQTLPSAAWHP